MTREAFRKADHIMYMLDLCDKIQSEIKGQPRDNISYLCTNNVFFKDDLLRLVSEYKEKYEKQLEEL